MIHFTTKILFAFILLGVISIIFEYVVLSSDFFEASMLVVFNAVYALKTIPVLDTLIDILTAVAIFELFYFTARYALKFMEWFDLTGANFLDSR